MNRFTLIFYISDKCLFFLKKKGKLSQNIIHAVAVISNHFHSERARKDSV